MNRRIAWIMVIVGFAMLAEAGYGTYLLIHPHPLRVAMLDEPGVVVLAFPGKGGWVGIHEMSANEPKLDALAPTRGKEVG
jgi:hypothetical protein